MRKQFLSFVGALFIPVIANANLAHVGTYQTIDDETNTPKSIVALYEYRNGDDAKLAGRIIALYGTDGVISETLSNPTRIADKVKGTPKMVGMDILWDMEWDNDDSRFEDGKIMDPKSGKVYSSVIWGKDAGKLNVRGKIGPFGRTQVWNTLDASALPADLQNLDTANWTPVVIK